MKQSQERERRHLVKLSVSSFPTPSSRQMTIMSASRQQTEGSRFSLNFILDGAFPPPFRRHFKSATRPFEEGI